MKTEISRDSHQPGKRYSGVYQQQGRMLTDADWNELVVILNERLSDALKDVVGSKVGSIGGTPRHRALKIVEEGAGTFKIQPGHIYVDGVAAQVPGDENIAYDAQLPDFPGAPILPASPQDNYVLYADVWERTVTHLMDERLRDKGLHGADTCTRKQTMAQVKWCPYDSVDPANQDNDPEQSAKNPAKGDAELTVTLLKKTTQPDDCDPCAAQLDVESKVGNYLFRVEVHDVKGDANGPSEITLKWSSENAAEQFEALPKKEQMPAGFISDKWVYEFFDKTSEKHLGVHLDTSWEPARVELKEIKEPSSPYSVPAIPGSSETQTFVRRWDGYCRLDLSSPGSLLSGVDRGIVLSTEKAADSLGYVKIDDFSLQAVLGSIKLDLALDGKIFVAGDYWLADVREAEHDPLDPEKSKLIESEPPYGIKHHYLTLGKVVDGVLQDNPEADRKYAFPPLTEMTRMFHVGGDGQEAMPNHFVPQSLKVGVTNGEWPVAGAKIEFSVTKGNGELEQQLPEFPLENFDPDNPTSGIATTDGVTRKGRVNCRWKLGPEERKQRVTVRLVDPDSNPDDADHLRYLDHPPIHFYANLSTADQVAYDPSEKADRWKDVNKEEEGEVLPSTVQEAIDDLVDNLQSEDIKYTPDCTEDTPPTVRSQLGIPADTSSRVHEVLDKLLCDFNATHLPIDKDDEELCGRLKVEGIETVQDALDTLCRMERGGSGCAVTVGENGGQHPTLKEAFDALAAEENISLCLMPGNHQVAAGLDISGKNSIKISGAGSQGSVIGAQGNMKLAADEIQFKDFGVDVAGFEHGISLKGSKIGADGCAFTRTDIPENIHLWSQNYKSTGREYGQGVAVDPEGNMLVTGYFTGKVDFDGTILTAAGEDLFVVKLDPEGKLLWVQSYPSTSNEHGLAIAVDADGNVLVTGHFDGEVTFGSKTLKARGTDLFVLKLEPDSGAVHWARNFKNSSSNEGHGVAVDGEGNVLLTGYFEGVVDADGKWLTAKGTDLFVIKLEPEAGNVLWAHNYESEGNEYGMGITVGPKGNVLLTGYFDGKVAFGEFELSAKGTDLFVLNLEPEAGKVLWAHNYESEGNEYGIGIAVDPEGFVILTGYFDGGVVFGEVELGAEGIDLFVVKLEPEAGKVLWANNYPHIGVDHGMAVAADPDGNVYVTGYFTTEAIFGDFRMRASGEDMFVLKLDPEGTEIWVNKYGGAGNQGGLGVAVNPKGYVHVTGYFSGRADFGDHKLTAMGVDLFALMLEPEKGDVSWVRNFSNVSNEGAMAVAVDLDGNALVTGSFNGAVDFGGQILEAIKTDVYVLKLDADGKTIWAKNYQGTSGESGGGIAVDVDGNVLITGWFDGIVNFDGHKLEALGSNDLFILKLNPKGDVIWAKNYQGPSSDVGSGIAVDADGNVLVTGRFVDALDFDGHKLVSEGQSDLFVLKLSPMGKVNWAKSYPGDGPKMGSGIAADAVGNALITGNFEGTVSFGQYKFNSAGIDLYVLKLNPEGDVIWARSFGNEGVDSGHDIAVDNIGNVIVTGQFNGTVEFDDFILRSEGIDLFVLKLEPEKGAVLWARNYQGSGIDVGHGVTADTSGHVFVTGVFRGEIDFDGRFLSAAGTDVFVLKLSTEGRVVWAHNFVSAGNEYGYGIAADRQGNVLVTGLFDGSVDFGGGTLMSVGLDLFITKLAIPDTAPPLMEIRPANDKGEADLNWNRNTMHMPPAGDAIANPGLRLDGIFDALALSGSTIGGNVENNRISGKVVLMSDFPDSMDIDSEGTVVGMARSRKTPFVAQSVLNIRSNELNNICSRMPLGELQNGILRNNELEFFGSMMLTNNTFRENESSFFGMRMTMTGNQFVGAVRHSDVAAIALGSYGTFSDNQAHPNAMIQRVLTFKKQSSNDLNFQDLTGFIGIQKLVLLNGEETAAGTVMTYSADHAPDGWMECDGSQINRTEYAALFDSIGTRFGAGNGSTTFNIPDLRGEFIRGWAHGRNVDAGRALGSSQGNQIQDHSHNVTRIPFASGAGPLAVYNVLPQSSFAGAETRPRNVALMFCIKY